MGKKDFISQRRPGLEGLDSPILKAIGYGVNAPNPHNTQAWKFKILSDTDMLFYIDESRLIPMTDPPARQIHIGSGCFIETLKIGATAMGYETIVEYFPEGFYQYKEIGQKPVAKISLSKNEQIKKDDLFDYIYGRQMSRKIYKGPLVKDEEFESINELVGTSDVEIIFLNKPNEMKPFFDIFYRAMEIECLTHHLYEETRIWFRYSEKERTEKRDGLSVPEIMGVDGLRRFIVEKYMKKGDPKRWFSDWTVESYLKGFKKGIASSKALVFLKTVTNDKLDWVKSGRTYARFHLAITKFGFFSHPYSQVLQEYQEMTDLQRKFNELLGIKGSQKIQMAVRIGRSDRPNLSYRRRINDFIIS